MSETQLPKPRLLDAINSPQDLRELDLKDLTVLAQEIRAEIVRVVTVNGGHLASSLGAVELIIALHHVFNTPYDQIVFDVGHQTYAHKILTGRAKDFNRIRQAGGISGFPRREESLYDVFSAGHSSTSISAAMGLATVRDLLGENRNVVAVIGDGALTGGMALEAINHAGGLQKNLLVILNDNRMSISPNVGAISQYLSLKMTSPELLSLREAVKRTLEKFLPHKGRRVIRRFQMAEEAMKGFLVSPNSFLACWGFKYLGPIDGHDLETLIKALRQVKGLNRPILLHVLTTKGKGYPPAERNPLAFHGLGRPSLFGHHGHHEIASHPKEVEVPEPPPPVLAPPKTYTEVFGRFLVKKAKALPSLVAITAAMSQGTGLDEFFRVYPTRAFDVGIAEQHAVTFAAGLAAGGLRPVVAIYSTFLQRAFDQLFHDVALANLPVIVAVDRAGLVGEDGPTHHGGLDLSFLRLLPNFTIMAPKDEGEMEAMLELAFNLDGPVAIRYPRGPVSGRSLADFKPLIKGQGEILKTGQDLTIIAIGQTVWPAYEAALILAKKHLFAEVINLRFIKPLDQELIIKSCEATRHVLTVEENSLTGGLYGAVSELLATRPLASPAVTLRGLGLTDQPVGQATQAQQRASLGLDIEGITTAAMRLFCP
ncbi:MAG: 1-deoxy-D-xylulose-5-phosphate synthase [Deltaproteobacteria bacterium]|jgi:1-deoxy-D-xylulose-5-phosphate synthase|nr:1-deoxy-D-xylulose-5-phosphate synthase [Deltaproteobacteria bacterium]